jgi:hypothetical protein
VYADQPNWINEWKNKCDENMELQARLKAVEDGSELVQMRRRLLQAESQLEVCKAAYNHRGVLLANALLQMDLQVLDATKK